MDSLRLTVCRKPSLSQLSPYSALLHPAERHSEIRVIAAVDPDHTSLKPAGNSVCPLHISCEDGTSQTISRIVCLCQCLLFCLKAGNHNERPKDLLAIDLHRVLHVYEYGRLDKVPFTISDLLVWCTSGSQCRSFTLPAFNVTQHLLVLRLCHLWALECILCKWIPNLTR